MSDPLADSSAANTEPGPPVCYRHPGRETYVSCVRCGRHACPDCMRAASVGQQCVECVREGSRTVRSARTAFGGKPASGAYVTWTLVGINVLIFLITLGKSVLGWDLAMVGLGIQPGGRSLVGVSTGEWYRMISSAFDAPTSGGWGGLGFADIVMNMWVLTYVGPSLEKVFGHVRYLTIYLLSALGGSVMFYWLEPLHWAAGASGAIFGLFGAWFVMSRRLNIDSRGIVMLIALNLAISFAWRSAIAWQDHIGGLIAGAIVAAAFAYAPRKNRTFIQVGATVGVLAIIVVATILKNHDVHQMFPTYF
jgi:membrane associated rhomboid family serine protease